MRISRSTRSDNTEQMLDAFNSRIEELSGEVVSTTSIIKASRAVDIYDEDDFEEYEDIGGGFGNPGEHYTMRNIKEYWNDESENDPSLVDYDSFDTWWEDTRNNYLNRIESCGVLGGCYEESAESSETELDEDLEEVTGEEDLMEELDSEFIEDSTEVTCAFDVNSIDIDELYQVIDKYNANSSPVSGDWDTETADEQQTIADAFNISLEDAKEVMIKVLGFPEDDAFIGASTDVEASRDYNIYSGYDDLEDTTWEELATKSVRDSDGFMTDYTLYYNTLTGKYVCMFGDKDAYTPDEGYADWEGETEEEAYEWFESFSDFEDDELF